MKKENEMISPDAERSDTDENTTSPLCHKQNSVKLTNQQKSKLRLIRNFSRALDYFVLILSLLALFVGVYTFWDTHNVMEIADSETYAVYKPNSEENLTFEELKKSNPDVLGWIDIYGTGIDYPIVQGKDNSEYLNKTVLGEFSTAGSIFLDSRNQKDFTDFQNIIYGHYMAEEKMFGDIELFKNKKFFNKHKYGVIHRADKNSLGIEFFAFVKTLGTDQMLLSTTRLKSDKKDLISYIYEKATYSRKIDFKENSSIVILDTCDLSSTNGRYVLIGKLSDKVAKNTFSDKVYKNKFSKFLSQIYQLDLLILLIVLWILLIAIYFVYEGIRRKNKGEEAQRNVHDG